MFVGKALIIVLSGWIAYLIIMNSSLKDKINSPIFPVVVVVIIAYQLSSIFLSVFSFSSTTILHCFIIDEEIKGSFAPASLKSFIDRNDALNAKRAAKLGGKPSEGDKAKEDEKKHDEHADEKPANNMA